MTLLEILVAGSLATIAPTQPKTEVLINIRPEIVTIEEIQPVEPLQAPELAKLPEVKQIPKPKPKTVTAPLRGSNAPAGWYQYGWCTYGAWKLAPWVGSWHDANTWDDMARSEGRIVSSKPVVGAVFVDNGGYYGHVGVVTGVYRGMVTIKEMNYKGFGVWSTRTVSASEFVYIYP